MFYQAWEDLLKKLSGWPNINVRWHQTTPGGRPFIIVPKRIKREPLFRIWTGSCGITTDSVEVLKALTHREFPYDQLGDALQQFEDEGKNEVIFEVVETDSESAAIGACPLRLVRIAETAHEWEARYIK